MGTGLKIDIVGAGIFGVWQALRLARDGHRVRLVESSPVPFATAQSRFAGAMLAPYCEAESAEPVVRDAGIEALVLWRAAYPDLVDAGTLVVAHARDAGELRRFARLAPGHERIDADRIAELEPSIGKRFASGLYFPDEAHMRTPRALAFLLEQAQEAGAEVAFGFTWNGHGAARAEGDADYLIDCRGLGARNELPSLRGVRGERLLVRARDVALNRPVRLLHPRYPLYVVPWGEGLHLVGATVIESEDDSQMTVRSALELLGMAYALSPAFGEAEIVELSAGVRPAFPDNVPHAVVRGRVVLVNGAHRHGFLLAPVMAETVARYIANGEKRDHLLRMESA
ncbi:MAG: FAD-dependent oxidoreductase [Hyphomicrobiaceae bacterium]